MSVTVICTSTFAFSSPAVDYPNFEKDEQAIRRAFAHMSEHKLPVNSEIPHKFSALDLSHLADYSRVAAERQEIAQQRATELLKEDEELLGRLRAAVAEWPQSYSATAQLRSTAVAYLADDPTRCDLDGMADFTPYSDLVLLYFLEHGLSAPGSLIEAPQANRESSLGRPPGEALAAVAEALTSGDTLRLAAAIDAAEARHLVVFAARMRIVLAQRTGDTSPLERARPVLEHLGDRQFLRRLEQVQAALH